MPHTFCAGDRPRGANPPTTSDLVWEKTNRGKSWRKQKKEVSQEKETLADNIDALARRVRQEAARYLESEVQRADRKSSHIGFLGKR